MKTKEKGHSYIFRNHFYIYHFCQQSSFQISQLLLQKKESKLSDLRD